MWPISHSRWGYDEPSALKEIYSTHAVKPGSKSRTSVFWRIQTVKMLVLMFFNHKTFLIENTIESCHFQHIFSRFFDKISGIFREKYFDFCLIYIYFFPADILMMKARFVRFRMSRKSLKKISMKNIVYKK